MTKRHEDCTLICLPNPAKTSWILEIHLETESTGSTLRTLATHWKCTVTWQRTEVRASVFYWDRDRKSSSSSSLFFYTHLLLLLCGVGISGRWPPLTLDSPLVTLTSFILISFLMFAFQLRFGLPLPVSPSSPFPHIALHNSRLSSWQSSTMTVFSLESSSIPLWPSVYFWSFHSGSVSSWVTPDIRLSILITRKHKTIKEAARIACQEILLRARLVVYLFSW